MNNHGLFALESGDQICVDGRAYTVEKLIYPGARSYVYLCHDVHGQALCIKEHFTTDSHRSRMRDEVDKSEYNMRNEVDKSEYNALIHDPEEKAEIVKQMQVARGFANAFKEGCPQGAFLPFAYDAELLTEVMCTAACKTVYEQVAEWEKTGLPPLRRVQETAQILETLLSGLGKAHEKGFLHGDLSGGNVMVAEFASVRVAFLIDLTSSIPLNGAFIPDRAGSEGFVDPHCAYAEKKIDLFAAGALIKFMLTGDKSDADLSDDYNIEQLLKDLDLPFGVKMKLTEVIKRACSIDTDVFADCAQMQAQVKILQEITERRGVHRERLVEMSIDYFCRQFEAIYKGTFDSDLLPETDREILSTHTLLVSDGGAGKTSLLFDAYRQQVEQLKRDATSAVPIYLSLAQFEEAQGWEFYIENSILRDYLKLPATEENRTELIRLFREESYVLYLDSLNEGIDTDRIGREIKTLMDDTQLRICVASRTEQVGWSCSDAFQIVRVKPLSEDAVQRKLSEYGLQPVYGRLLGTLSVPMWLSMYVQLRLKTNDAVVTPGDLLQKHHEHLLYVFYKADHKKEWRQIHKKVLDDLLPVFATEISRMYFTQNAAEAALKTVQQLGEIATILEPQGKNPEKVVLDMLVDAGILRRIDEKSLIFSHQRFLEFYVAKYIHGQMVNGQLPNILCEGIISSGIAQFLGDLFGEYNYDKKRDCLGDASPIEQWLHDRMCGRNDRKAQLCIRNLIDTMRYARKGMISGDYSDLDLSLVNFYDCCIPGSNFVNTSGIEKKTFCHCGHQQHVDEIAILRAFRRVVTAACGEKTIYFWDILTGEITDQIQHNENIHLFRISADEQLLMLCTMGRVSVYRIEDGTKVGDLQVYTPEDSSLHTKERRKVLVDFYKDGRILCSCGPNGEDQVVLWDINTKNSEILLDLSKGYTKASDGYTQCSALSADHRILYAVSNREELTMWDLLRRKPKSESFWVFSKLEAFTISPNKKYAGMLTEDKMLLLMDLSTGAIEKVCGSIENDSCGRIRESNLIYATNDQLLWGGNWNLSGYKFETKKVIQFAVPQISAFAINKETIVFADVSGKIRIGNIDEQRVVSSFEWGGHTDWCSLHDTIPHVYDGGIARIVGKINQVQTYSENGVSTITAYGNHSDCFDKNYHICLETNTDELVIRDLRTGSVVTRVPYDSLCIAYDDAGKVIFNEQSDFQWARYYEAEKKLIVNYWVGLTRIFDFNTKIWKPIGEWDQEIAFALKQCEINDREALCEGLLDIAFRTYLLGAYIVRATYDGRIQIWNLQGEKEMDVYAHNERVERIYEIPGSTFFASEDAEWRCIWDLETFRMIKIKREGSLISAANILGILPREVAEAQGFNLQGNSFRLPQSGESNLVVYGEAVEDYILLACAERDSTPSQREVSNSGRIVVYYDDPENTKHYHSYIRVYDTATGIRLHNYDLLRARPLPLENDLVEFTNYFVNISLSESQLAVAFADGCVLVYDLLAKHDKVNFVWHATDVYDLSDCYFGGIQMANELKTILNHQGAIVE